MPTLVIRNVPDDLYLRLKETAAAHHRSMTQETIVLLKQLLTPELPPLPARPTWDEFAASMSDLWALPVEDHRTTNEIIGYNERGYFD